jgi:hypothetical protein
MILEVWWRTCPPQPCAKEGAAFGLNCQVFLDSCRLRHLSFFINILNMKTYILFCRLVKLCQIRMGQSQRLAFQSDFDFGLAVFGLIN